MNFVPSTKALKKNAPRILKLLFFLAVFSTLAFFPSDRLLAQEDSYDRYGAVWPEGSPQRSSKSAEGLQNFEDHFLAYPFELVRWPVNKTLIYVEETHLKDKVDWIYERMKDFGITPSVYKGSSVRDKMGANLSLEFIKLLHLKEQFPDLSVEAKGIWTMDPVSSYSLKIRQDRIFETGFFAGGNFKYENRGDEHFYGLGPDSSLGDTTSYKMERTTLEGVLGYEFLNTWNVKETFGYRNVNITNGRRGGSGVIDTIFMDTGRENIPGLAGDRVLSWDLDLEHDNRDSKDAPTVGGYERLHFGVNKGMENDTGYLKYRAEAGHFFKLFSDRRIFAIRGLAEQNSSYGERKVPFFEMARLGGYGANPRFGDVQRGYMRDRFYDSDLLLFNVEYRWAVLEYRSWTMDSVLFSDIGQVFDRWKDFSLGDMKVSYGLGFRLNFEKNQLIGFEIARANEGTELYVTSKAPF